jgi:cytochrome d ubiquinol oxidase subunit II
METLWFALVALMLTAYVVFDGFDLGAGALLLFLGRTDEERRTVIRTIGPVWDGNEVWLLAGGGTLYFAFPLLYASSFSGFYLPLNIVLWLLILRGVGIEFRLHTEHAIWTRLFDGFIALSSLLLAVFLGAAMGNVMRGVDLDEEHFFFAPLWTDFRVGPETGILDWYTVGSGVLALVALIVHGALWVRLKTSAPVNDRARRVADALVPVQALLTALGVPATAIALPHTLANYREHGALFVVPLGVAASLAAVWVFNRKGEELRAFLSSCAYLTTMLVGGAVALYPNLLPSSGNPKNGIDIHNAAAGEYALSVGLIWWMVGMALAVGYFVFVYRHFRGKVLPGGH